MRKLGKVFIITIVFLLSGSVYADKIAVWNLKPQAGVTEKESITVSSILTSEIERISGKKIISESEIRSIIEGETMKIECGVDDNVCIAEIGASLGAPFSVSGILSKMGDYWVITLQLIDVRKVEVKSRVTKRFKGEENTLIEALTPLVCKLLGKENCEESTEEKVIVEEISPSDNIKLKEGETKPSVDRKRKEKKIKPPKKERTPASWQKVTGWTFTTVGALALAGGVFSNIQMNSARDKFISAGKRGDEDKFKMWRGLSIGGYIAGSVFIAGGVTLIVIDAVAPEKSRQNNVSFYLVPHVEGFAGGIEWRW